MTPEPNYRSFDPVKLGRGLATRTLIFAPVVLAAYFWSHFDQSMGEVATALVVLGLFIPAASAFSFLIANRRHRGAK